GLAAPLIDRLTVALPDRGRTLALSLLAHACVLVCLSFLFGLVAHTGLWREWLLGSRAPGYHAMSTFSYALIVLCSLALKFYRLSLLREKQAAAAVLNAAQLDNQLNIARVSSLQMQMNPHFLFNALNSIAALIETDQRERAYDAVERLGSLLREALKLSDSDDVPLASELAFCRAYLAMEKIRFAERLTVEWQIDTEADWLIPAFTLQPIIENTIKHAVSVSEAPVTVRIAVRQERDTLVLSVTDNGPGDRLPSTANGIGLGNLRARLALVFDERARFEAGPLAVGYRTRLGLPLEFLTPSPSR
ncbi:MAG: histidine kinase, partial [Pseudomonadota bacterium]